MKLTDEEKRYIEEHYLTQKASVIAAALGRTPEGIRCYAKRAGLSAFVRLCPPQDKQTRIITLKIKIDESY